MNRGRAFSLQLARQDRVLAEPAQNCQILRDFRRASNYGPLLGVLRETAKMHMLRDQGAGQEIRAASATRLQSRSVLRAILLGGVVAGTIDIGAASLIYERSIPFILHSIAGGLLSDRSFALGAPAAVLGLFLQEFMGILIAAVYVVASRFLAALRRHWFMWGLLYGALIFVVMNYVVLPLSAWRVVPHFSAWTLAGSLAAMFLFGVIVAFFSNRVIGTVSTK